MPRNRLPSVMKHYSPIVRRNHGRPLKRLLDTWDRNGSTSSPTPWQIHDDDDYYGDDDDDDDDYDYRVLILKFGTLILWEIFVTTCKSMDDGLVEMFLWRERGEIQTFKPWTEYLGIN